MRSGKEAQRKRVQKETNRDKQVCVCQSLCSTREEDCCRRTNTHPHKHLSLTHTAPLFLLIPVTQQMVTRLFSCTDKHTLAHIHTLSSGRKSTHVCVYVCAFVCVCVWACILECVSVSAKVQAIVVLAQNKPLSAPPAHGETGREQSGDIGWMEGRGKRKERKRRARARERKRTIEGEGLDSCLLPSLEASSSQS